MHLLMTALITVNSIVYSIMIYQSSTTLLREILKSLKPDCVLTKSQNEINFEIIVQIFFNCKRSSQLYLCSQFHIFFPMRGN